MKSIRRQKKVRRRDFKTPPLRLLMERTNIGTWTIRYQDDHFHYLSTTWRNVEFPTPFKIKIDSCDQPQFDHSSGLREAGLHVAVKDPLVFKEYRQWALPRVIFLRGTNSVDSFSIHNSWTPESCPANFIDALKFWAKQIKWPKNPRPSLLKDVESKNTIKNPQVRHISRGGSIILGFYG